MPKVCVLGPVDDEERTALLKLLAEAGCDVVDEEVVGGSEMNRDSAVEKMEKCRCEVRELLLSNFAREWLSLLFPLKNDQNITCCQKTAAS